MNTVNTVNGGIRVLLASQGLTYSQRTFKQLRGKYRQQSFKELIQSLRELEYEWDGKFPNDYNIPVAKVRYWGIHLEN